MGKTSAEEKSRPNPLTEITQELWTADAPITYALVGAITGIFIMQYYVALETGASPHAVADYLFLEYPAVAWPLGFLLHKGILHFLANVLMILFFGTLIEEDFTPKQYLVFLAVTWIITIAAGGLVMHFQSGEGPVSSFGASGFPYALITYGASITLIRRERWGIVEIIWVLMGIAVVLQNMIQLFQGSLTAVRGFNGAHLSGAILGIIIALYFRARLGI